MNTQTVEPNETSQNSISYYSLDFMQKGEQHYYIWRHHAGKSNSYQAVLIDLKNIYLPDGEIDKLLLALEGQGSASFSVAFANCHAHNQREIKRKLKACNVKLFSHTAFFSDFQQAKQWLCAPTSG